MFFNIPTCVVCCRVCFIAKINKFLSFVGIFCRFVQSKSISDSIYSCVIIINQPQYTHKAYFDTL